jgi:hypothetical protein
MMCGGILGTQFGRRKSNALTKAMIQLRAEQAAATDASLARSYSIGCRGWLLGWSTRLQPRSRVAFAFSLLAVIGGALWFMWAEHVISLGAPVSAASFCKLSDSLDARWSSKSPKVKLGEPLGKDLMRLESGVIELTFSSGATVALEGPAQFRIRDYNLVELVSGKMSADVPKRARGFAVKSPTATVTDLGTRFGEIVNSATEVDVFQGNVELSAADRAAGGPWRLSQGKGLIVDPQSAVTAAALPESAFPQPSLTVLARPQNCGFDVSARAVTGGMPSDPGYWSGPAFTLIGPAQHIRPFEGAGMLRFLSPPGNPTGDSEVWQLIDLRPYKKLLARGDVEARVDSMFNRITNAPGAADTFGLALAAFHGLPANSRLLWQEHSTRALAFADKQLKTDDNPATWEKIEFSVQLPPDADFVVVQIRAIAPQSGVADFFPGHFADRVDLKLCTRLRASSISTSR